MKQKHPFRNLQPGHSSEQSEHEDQLLHAIRDAENGHLERAFTQLGRIKLSTDAVRNAQGVCFLRLGKYDEAVQLFRRLVLASGGTWMKSDLPVIYRTNFCTALLLAGHPCGCYNSLCEIPDRDHPSVVRLHQALKEWTQQISWWQRLLWKLGVEPDAPVKLTFTPGDFFEQAGEPPTTPHGETPMPRAA